MRITTRWLKSLETGQVEALMLLLGLFFMHELAIANWEDYRQLCMVHQQNNCYIFVQYFAHILGGFALNILYFPRFVINI